MLELVDRPGENWASGHIHSWGGIGVNNVRVKDVELAWHDWARRHDCDPAHPVPFPPAIPGIWIEMNKGPHIRILENHLGNGMVATLERDSLPLPKTIGEVKSERDDSAVPTT